MQRKKLVDDLVEECSENIDESEWEWNDNATFNDYENACGSCAIYTVFIFIGKQ